jgi:hypothetical protein
MEQNVAMNDRCLAVLQHSESFGFDDSSGEVVAREGADRVQRLPDRMCRQFDEVAVIASQ